MMFRVIQLTLLLSCFSATVLGKNVRVQIDFEDMLKLLPMIGNNEGFRKLAASVTSSVNSQTDTPAKKYNNPYHPEDDAPEVVTNEGEDSRKDDDNTLLVDEDKLNKLKNEIEVDLSKNITALEKQFLEEAEGMKVGENDDDMEKANDNYIKEKEVISEDELTDAVKSIDDVSNAVRKLTHAANGVSEATNKTLPDTSSPVLFIDRRNDDRSDFKPIQKRFVLKGSGPTGTTNKFAEKKKEPFGKYDILI